MQATDFQHSPACNGEEMKHYMQSGSHMLGCGFVPAVIFSFQKVYSNVKVMTNYILITLYIFFTVLNSLNSIQLGSTMHVIIYTLALVGLATRVSVVLGTCLHYVGGGRLHVCSLKSASVVQEARGSHFESQENLLWAITKLEVVSEA